MIRAFIKGKLLADSRNRITCAEHVNQSSLTVRIRTMLGGRYGGGNQQDSIVMLRFRQGKEESFITPENIKPMEVNPPIGPK